MFTCNLQEIADGENYEKYDDDDDGNDADCSQCVDDLHLFYNKQQTTNLFFTRLKKNFGFLEKVF